MFHGQTIPVMTRKAQGIKFQGLSMSDTKIRLKACVPIGARGSKVGYPCQTTDPNSTAPIANHIRASSRCLLVSVKNLKRDLVILQPARKHTTAHA
jgi:hypothetical protein